MFYRLSRLAEKYYHWCSRVIGLEKTIRLRIVNFDKPWWFIVTERWFLWSIIISGRIVTSAFITLVPLFIGKALESGTASSFGWLFVVWLLIEVWRIAAVYLFDVEQGRISYGVQYSAYRFFLGVDPIYHAMRTSGRLFAKIERGARAYELLVMSVVYEFLPIIIGMVTVVVSFFALKASIGFIALCFLSFLTCFNLAAILFNAFVFESKFIMADDEMKAASMESLTRIELVRSCFATNELDKLVRRQNRVAAAVFSTNWVIVAVIMLISRIGYALSVCTIGLYVLSLIKQGNLTVGMGVGLLITYLHGSYRILRIGDKAHKITRYVVRVKDLFSFISRFGVQSFPVLYGEVPERQLPTVETIVVQAEGLSFAYTKKAQIFEEHALQLVVPRSQKNKLYGVIGPSGVGKTTLISVLGGQLRPTTGTVKINGVPMYEVGDDTRQQLVAMQGQTASNLSGTVRDSLLLGLPKDEELFSDDMLISILKKVAVWKLFKEKEGLESSIGEGGLNLSVGQRQRLNFASLYLRTTYFKPSLILIDEPTSSLDQISEQAITDMIDELARDAVTFVIAHRLHTLEKAVGIMDVSLLAQEKELTFYTRDELLQRSAYYQRLTRGEVAIEE